MAACDRSFQTKEDTFTPLERARLVFRRHKVGKRAIGTLADLKEQDFNFLEGHFPNFRVVPGAIIMEALAELLGVTAVSGLPEVGNKIGVLVEDRMRYRQMIKPGEAVRLEAEVTNMRSNIGKGNVKALLGDKVAAEGEITFALVDKPTT